MLAAVILGFLSLLPCRLAKGWDGATSDSCASNASRYWSEPVIVQFKQYAPWRSHAAALARSASSVGCDGVHRVVERRNPAMQYPTDFLLIELGRAGNAQSHSCALHAIQHHDGVTGVYPQHSYAQPRRALSNGGVDSMGAARDAAVPEQHPNVSTHQSRRRQQSGNDRGMAAKLNARNLWVNGKRGKGVKIAVVDSGMPGTHPGFARGTIKQVWPAVVPSSCS
jgi:hypothetical protein